MIEKQQGFVQNAPFCRRNLPENAACASRKALVQPSPQPYTLPHKQKEE